MKNDCLYNENEMLARVANGDQRAFVLLVEQYTPAIYAHVLKYVKSGSRAEEITQDIFMKVWQHRDQLPGLDNFRGYLYVITRNSTVSAFRKKIITWKESRDDEPESSNLNPAGAMELRQLSDVLARGIESLPPRRKQVFRMSRFDGLSYEEIAVKLQISKSSVNQHIVEALLFLRTYLKNHMAMIAIVFACHL